MSDIRLYFKESNGYSAPIHQDLLNKLQDRGWRLIREIGRGTTNVAFLAIGNEKSAAVLIPVAQEYPEKNAPVIMELQNQGKLQSVVSIYDWFYTDVVVDKKELLAKIEEGEVMYPDYVSNDVGYNILITELLAPLGKNDLPGIKEALDDLNFDGWCQNDLHLDNFGVSCNGKVKILDIESLDNSPCDYSYFSNKL